MNIVIPVLPNERSLGVMRDLRSVCTLARFHLGEPNLALRDVAAAEDYDHKAALIEFVHCAANIASLIATQVTPVPDVEAQEVCFTDERGVRMGLLPADAFGYILDRAGALAVHASTAHRRASERLRFGGLFTTERMHRIAKVVALQRHARWYVPAFGETESRRGRRATSLKAEAA